MNREFELKIAKSRHKNTSFKVFRIDIDAGRLFMVDSFFGVKIYILINFHISTIILKINTFLCYFDFVKKVIY